MLGQLADQLDSYRIDILDNVFDSLSIDTRCAKLDSAGAFVKSGLSQIAHFEAKSKAREKMATYQSRLDKYAATTKEKRNSLMERLKAFHAQICALYAPLLAEHPLVIDAGNFNHLQ